MTVFRDRWDAGRQLAAALTQYANRPDVLVLALPRGGLPVGYEVSQALNAPLDVLLVRKLGLPGNEELAIGAVALGGDPVLNQDLIDTLGIPESVIDAVLARERLELERRNKAYRGETAPPTLTERTVILVDDGLATGATMRAAVRAAYDQYAQHVVVAVPVGSELARTELREEADEVVCLTTPEPFWAVGQWYENFPQISDDEVREILHRAHTQEKRAVGKE